MSRARKIEGIESRLQSIAFDVGQHFSENFKGTGLKGQVAASSKRAAIQLKKLFDLFGVVSAEVVISAPEMRESDDEVDESDDDIVRSFWRKMMERYGGEDAYNKTIVEQFKGPGDPEIIIVVEKLLTGFDAPRNTVLYIARKLKEHGLLQAIARVNRVFDEESAPEKPFGFIIDYTGVLKDLGAALASYDVLEGFSEEDIASSLTAIRDEANKVPVRTLHYWISSSPSQIHSTLKHTLGFSLARRYARTSMAVSQNFHVLSPSRSHHLASLKPPNPNC